LRHRSRCGVCAGMFLFMTRLPRFVAVAVLLGGSTVFLSACSDSSEPAVSSTPTPIAVSESLTPSASPTPTALSDEELLELIPESARLENFGSAANFARFFLRESHRIFVDREPEAFAFSAAPDCAFCASVLSSYDEHLATNSRVEGGDIEVDATEAVGGLQDDGTWLVQVPITVSAAQYFNSDGTLRSSEEAATYDTGMSLAYLDGHWNVLGFNSQPSD